MSSKTLGMRKLCTYLLYFTSIYCLLFAGKLIAAPWQVLSNGLEYLELKTPTISPWSHIHVFRIDLNHYQLSSVMASSINKDNATADEFLEHHHALIAINSGFFDEHFHPLGLRINHNKIHSNLKTISWWGIFYIKNHLPNIVTYQQFNHKSPVEFAVQSGPRLLVNKQITPLKAGYAERSALGITANNKVILLVTENAAMSLDELAKLLKSSPLHCRYAINLDGGGSSQLSAHIDGFIRNVHGFLPVSDAIIVTPRTN